MATSRLQADRLRTGSRWAIAAGAGFVLGIVFWQFSGPMRLSAGLGAAGPAVADSGAMPAARHLVKLDGRIDTVAAASCTALALDRATGQTVALACPPTTEDAQNARLADREDKVGREP